ncbi:MAG: isochorismate synthase [Bacteroidia bacterium]|jgi:isochorismate synthase
MDLNELNQRFNSGTKSYFAAIRFPGEKDTYFFYASPRPGLKPMKLKTGKPSFVCSPYAAGNLAYLFDANLIYKNDTVIYQDQWYKELDDLDSEMSGENRYASLEHYTAYVNEAIQTLKQEKLNKVVAARSEKVAVPDSFNRAAYFLRLCEHYPEACVYYFSIPGIGTWAGASPEKLLALDEHKLSTVALAGTRLQSENRAWTIKEKQEQSITASYIRKKLQQQDITFNESEVESITTGELQHLSSWFEGTFPQEEQEEKWNRLLNKLNPTPAVCGEPRDKAMSFIAEHENLERRFYSGFIGMTDGNGNARLFVNIRCLQWVNDAVILYAGAGITPDSVANEEWKETERKLNALRNLL